MRETHGFRPLSGMKVLTLLLVLSFNNHLYSRVSVPSRG